MKSFTIFRKPSFSVQIVPLFLFLFFVLLTAPSFSANQPSQSTKERERILRLMKANEQLKEYRQQLGIQGIGMKKMFIKDPGVKLEINSSVQTTSTVYFYDNMENGTNGWTTGVLSGGSDDLWHQTTANSSSAPHSWWAGLDGQGNYNTGNRINAVLVSPSIDLSTAVEPISLLYTESFMTEQGWDFCMVEISNDGGASWIPLNGLYGHSPNGNSKGWKITSINLNAFAGGIVKLRFHFDTGDAGFNEFPGWFVDDVMIYDHAGTISGKTFFDLNNNGIKETGERGLQDRLITATGPVTLSMRTNDWGNFHIPLPLGSYTVNEALPSGWSVTMPVGGVYTVDLATADTTVSSLFFGDYKAGITVTGKVYSDVDESNDFNSGDTVLTNWRVNLYNAEGELLDFNRTDSLGNYILYIFESGNYVVEEEERLNWVSVEPDSGFTRITVANLNTNFSNVDFGNHYDQTTNTIIGRVYHDLNASGTLDDHEPMLSGWKVHIFGQGVGNKYRVTDDSGYYAFMNLMGCKTYHVEEIHQAGYCQSQPESTYAIALCNGEMFDGANFGNFVSSTGSVSGKVFFDRNNNASIDSNEAGLSGFTINLSGTANGELVNLSAVTDTAGTFAFSGLWSGSYTVSEVGKLGWWQSSPADLGSYTFALGCEEVKTGLLFGNLDSLYLGSFRTFTAESLALAKDGKGKSLPVEVKPIKDEFAMKFTSAEIDSVGKLWIYFTNAISLPTIVTSKSATIDHLNRRPNTLVLSFIPYLQPGDSVIITGYSPKPKLEVVTKWHWTFVDGKKSLLYKQSPFFKNILRLPMPNAWNGVKLISAGLRVGLGGAHSVVHPSYKEVIRSLVEKGTRMHIGAPRCLDKNTRNRSILKQLKYLTPTDGQNSLFAKVIALKVNILESQATITSPGFGGLIYDDGTGASNPLNNLSVYEIAAKVDSFMTQASSCTMLPSLSPLTVDQLDSLVGLINSSFSGPIDTLRFGAGLRYTPVRMLSEVPFFRYDSSVNARQDWIDMTANSEEPEHFEVYQNYPNPFNPSTVIRYSLSVHSIVTLKVYNVLGQEVVTLLNGESMEAGFNDVSFNASNLPSGVYFYRVTATGVDDHQIFNDVKRMMLIK